MDKNSLILFSSYLSSVFILSDKPYNQGQIEQQTQEQLMKLGTNEIWNQL